jgi:hypothetical protein
MQPAHFDALNDELIAETRRKRCEASRHVLPIYRERYSTNVAAISILEMRFSYQAIILRILLCWEIWPDLLTLLPSRISFN